MGVGSRSARLLDRRVQPALGELRRHDAVDQLAQVVDRRVEALAGHRGSAPVPAWRARNTRRDCRPSWRSRAMRRRSLSADAAMRARDARSSTASRWRSSGERDDTTGLADVAGPVEQDGVVARPRPPARPASSTSTHATRAAPGAAAPPRRRFPVDEAHRWPVRRNSSCGGRVAERHSRAPRPQRRARRSRRRPARHRARRCRSVRAKPPREGAATTNAPGTSARTGSSWTTEA